MNTPFKMKPGRSNLPKTGSGIPSGLSGGPKMTDPKDKKQTTSSPQHPGFDKSYYGKGFEAAEGDTTGVVNVLNEREYNKGRERQQAWEKNNKFPTVDSKLKGRLKKYRVNSIDQETGDYTISPKDGFRGSNNKNVTRRQMRQSLMHDTYDPLKQGKGTPLKMKSPSYQKNGPGDDREKEVQKRFPGAVKRKGTINEYSYKGVSLTPGYKQENVPTNNEQIAKALKNKKKK